MFYVTKRVGGGLLDPSAIWVLKLPVMVGRWRESFRRLISIKFKISIDSHSVLD